MDWLAGHNPDAPELTVPGVDERWLARLRELVPEDPRTNSLDAYRDHRIDPDVAPAWRALLGLALQRCRALARAEAERGGRLPQDPAVRARVLADLTERGLRADPFVGPTRELLALLECAIEQRLPVHVLAD